MKGLRWIRRQRGVSETSAWDGWFDVSSSDIEILTPMSAAVRSVEVRKGDVVKPLQVLVILEAMKTEIVVRADGVGGEVGSVLVKPGSVVNGGQVLLSLKAV